MYTMKQAYQNIKLYLSRNELLDMDDLDVEELEELFRNTEDTFKKIKAKRAFIRQMISAKQRLAQVTKVVEGMTDEEKKYARRVLEKIMPPKS